MAETFLAHGMSIRILTEQELIEKYPKYAEEIKERKEFHLSFLDAPSLNTRGMYECLGKIVTIQGRISHDSKGQFFGVMENPYMWDLTVSEPLELIPLKMMPYKNRKEE